jgi:hypothetical protein
MRPGAGRWHTQKVTAKGIKRRLMAVFAIGAISAVSAIAGIVVTLAVTDPLAPVAGRTPAIDGNWDGRNASDMVPVVSMAEAKQIALREAGDGQTTEAELEWEHGVLVWSVDVMKLSVEYDVDIDAATGAVLWYGLDN